MSKYHLITFKTDKRLPDDNVTCFDKKNIIKKKYLFIFLVLQFNESTSYNAK